MKKKQYSAPDKQPKPIEKKKPQPAPAPMTLPHTEETHVVPESLGETKTVDDGAYSTEHGPADPEAQTPAPVEKPEAPTHPENPDRLSGSELKAKQRQERRESRLKEKGY